MICHTLHKQKKNGCSSIDTSTTKVKNRKKNPNPKRHPPSTQRGTVPSPSRQALTSWALPGQGGARSLHGSPVVTWPSPSPPLGPAGRRRQAGASAELPGRPTRRRDQCFSPRRLRSGGWAGAGRAAAEPLRPGPGVAEAELGGRGGVRGGRGGVRVAEAELGGRGGVRGQRRS